MVQVRCVLPAYSQTMRQNLADYLGVVLNWPRQKDVLAELSILVPLRLRVRYKCCSDYVGERVQNLGNQIIVVGRGVLLVVR